MNACGVGRRLHQAACYAARSSGAVSSSLAELTSANGSLFFTLYKSGVTDFKTFPGRPHLVSSAPGWEEIADYVLAWALRHATAPPAIVPAPSAPAEPMTV